MNPALSSATDALARNLAPLQAEPTLTARLDALMPCRALRAGQALFLQERTPKAFYMVASGEIEARFALPDGSVSVLEHVRPPRLFGLAAFVTGGPARYEAVAREASRVWVIAEPAYRVLMDEWPGFARALMREFAERFEKNLRLLEAARHLDAPARFRVALRQLVQERGGPADAEGWRTLRATQAELAQMAHLSRQTVNQLLAGEEAAGRLRRRYGHIDIRTATR